MSIDEKLRAIESSAARNGRRSGGAPHADAILTAPTIVVSGKTLSNVTDLAIAALAAANDPPRLFRSGGAIVRVERDEHTLPVIRAAKLPEMRHELDRAANWQTMNREGDCKPTTPRRELVENVLATPLDRLPFPALRGVVTAPFFSNGGTLAVATGYVPTAKVYLDLDPEIVVPEIAGDDEAVRAAVALVNDELLIDFPIADDASRAHAFGLLLLPFVREMIDGPTPLHVIDAPAPGSGKSLLAKTLLLPGVGDVPLGVLGREEEETRKRLLSIISAGRPAIVLDNLSGKVDSATLSAVLTAWPHWQDRLLGTNTAATFDARTVWAASANNVQFSTEIARRSITVRLDAGLERPEERDESAFRFHLPEHVREHRGRFIAAALTIVAGWIAKGKPRPTNVANALGSFEAWRNVIGGILESAGIMGFLGDRERVMAESDSESANWRRFVTAWHDGFERENGDELERITGFGSREATAAQLLRFAEVAGFDLGTEDPKKGAMRLGRRLSAKKDCVFAGRRIARVPHKNTTDGWKLQAPQESQGVLGGTLGYLGHPPASENGSVAYIQRPAEVPPSTPSTPLSEADATLDEIDAAFRGERP